MQDYTKNICYLNSKLTKGRIIDPVNYPRLQIDPDHPSYADADKVFSQSRYKYPYLPLHLGEYTIPDVNKIDVNVLRLLIRENNEKASIHLPKELLPLQSFVLDNINYHRQFYPANKDCFVYITVRHSTFSKIFYKEAFTWHIDGFQGTRLPRHIIEQDIFWCNKSPTEFLLQPMFCEGLNPSKHDINDFFNYKAEDKFKVTSKTNNLYLATPYNIHRVNPNEFEGERLFIRLNFSPVEIEDNTNTQNPMLPREYSNRIDVRNFIGRFHIDEKIDSGFDI